MSEWVPLGVDGGLVGTALLDIVLTWIGMPLPWLRQLTRLLMLATVFANAAAGWADPVATGLPALRSFAEGLPIDHDAVAAGLALPYSNGPTEGVVNNIKMLKRQMYGQAGLPLLRKRILLAQKHHD